MSIESFPQKQVLLVDDEVNLTKMLSMLLETRGYQVRVAGTAKESLEMACEEYDLIILDLVLPDLDGFEVCRRLKQGKHTRHIPIIMLSAHSLYEDKVEALYLGADDFICKPCDQEELFARMEAVMRRNGGNGHKASAGHEESIVCELRRILDEALITPHFQPIYLFPSMKFYGMEILSRPTVGGSLENPETFFKAALQYGMYTEMEILSWSLALTYLSKKIGEEKVFLNCNPYFIESSQFLRVKAMLEKNHIKPQNVVLEITERSAISNFELFYERLTHYREHGLKFAIDDVGGGYASLESIVKTKPEVVKIDRHIVKDLSTDSYKQSIVKFIVSFCRENDILCVGEGIETLEDLVMARDLGIDAGQGFYLYKPTSKIDLENFYAVGKALKSHLKF